VRKVGGAFPTPPPYARLLLSLGGLQANLRRLLPGGTVENPERWDFSKHRAADLVVINIGTNDANSHNNVSNVTYVESYKRLIAGIHGVWPQAQVVVMVRPSSSGPVGRHAVSD